MDYYIWLIQYLKNYNLNGNKISDIEKFNNYIYLNRYSKNIEFIINEVYRKVFLSDTNNTEVNINFDDFVSTTSMSNIMYLAETILGIDTVSKLKKYFIK